jgi:DNA-binding NarL/FixJ family response regulator
MGNGAVGHPEPSGTKCLDVIQRRIGAGLLRLLTSIKREIQDPELLRAVPATATITLGEVSLDGYTYILTRLPSTGRCNLTDRERQIALLVRQGCSNKIVARELGISTFTVGTHLRRIFTKLGIDSRVCLAQLIGALDART